MKKIILALIIVVALCGGIYTVASMEKIEEGYVGVVYTMKNGVQNETSSLC